MRSHKETVLGQDQPAIVKNAVRHRLAAVGDTSCGTESVAMIELARAASSLAQTRRVNRRSIAQDRTGRRASIRDKVPRSPAVHLLSTQVVAIILKSVGGCTRISDLRHPVFVIIRQRSDRCSDRDRRAVAVVVVSVTFAASAAEGYRGELIPGIRVGVGNGAHSRARDFGGPVRVVIVGISERVPCRGGVIPHFTRQLVAGIETERGHDAIRVRSTGDIACPIVGILVMRQNRRVALFVVNVGRTIGGIEGIVKRRVL